MAVLTPTKATNLAGTALQAAFVAANAGGDKIANPGSRTFLLVKCADATQKVVTVVDPRTNPNGTASPDLAVTVAATTGLSIIPIGSEYANTDGQVDVTYDAVTSLTVLPIYL